MAVFSSSTPAGLTVNPEYCSNFNGIILPLATNEGHSRVRGENTGVSLSRNSVNG